MQQNKLTFSWSWTKYPQYEAEEKGRQGDRTSRSHVDSVKRVAGDSLNTWSLHIYILFPLLMFLHLVAPKLRTGSPLLHHAATLHLHYQFRHVPCYYAMLGFVYVG